MMIIVVLVRGDDGDDGDGVDGGDGGGGAMQCYVLA